MRSTPHVLLAENHPMVRSSTRRILEADGFTVCAEASDADGAIEAAVRDRPDVCLIEVLLPGDGLRAVSEIATRLPSTAMVVLSASTSRHHLLAAIEAGATGYLLKDMNPARIPAALRGVLSGEAAIPRTLVLLLVQELQSRGNRRRVFGAHGRADLTAREWEVLDLMKAGLNTREIGERLFISPVTVRRHISSTLDKLGVSSREEAVAALDAPRRAESRASAR